MTHPGERFAGCRGEFASALVFVHRDRGCRCSPVSSLCGILRTNRARWTRCTVGGDVSGRVFGSAACFVAGLFCVGIDAQPRVAAAMISFVLGVSLFSIGFLAEAIPWPRTGSHRCCLFRPVRANARLCPRHGGHARGDFLRQPDGLVLCCS